MTAIDRDPKRTVNNRIQIGFPDKPQDWLKAPAIYDDKTLKIFGQPVMEDWETGYMKHLARIATSKGGKVLELGFGMGISAGFIQENPNIDSHWVVECHPDVIARGLQQFREPIAEGKMHFLTGFWQEVVPQLRDASFDGILFDTYPLTVKEIHGNHFPFLEAAMRLLKPGGVFTYYSDEVNDFSEAHRAKLIEAGFKDSSILGEISHVNPPADCEYWKHNTILAPIIHKSA